MTEQGPPETVAFMGVGKMGGLLSARLLAAGHPVRAYDPGSAALARAVALGAHGADSPRDAAAGVEIAVLSLPSPEIVEEVVAGEDGLLAVLGPGGVIVDMSTTRLRPAASPSGRPSGAPPFSTPR